MAASRPCLLRLLLTAGEREFAGDSLDAVLAVTGGSGGGGSGPSTLATVKLFTGGDSRAAVLRTMRELLPRSLRQLPAIADVSERVTVAVDAVDLLASVAASVVPRGVAVATCHGAAVREACLDGAALCCDALSSVVSAAQVAGVALHVGVRDAAALSVRLLLDCALLACVSDDSSRGRRGALRLLSCSCAAAMALADIGASVSSSPLSPAALAAVAVALGVRDADMSAATTDALAALVHQTASVCVLDAHVRVRCEGVRCLAACRRAGAPC
jgi:hypothetical protein